MRLPLQSPLDTPQGPQQEYRQVPGPEATSKDRVHTTATNKLPTIKIRLPSDGMSLATGTTTGDREKRNEQIELIRTNAN